MNIPEKTIERLSEYRRTLLSCHEQGITHIFSHVLAGIHGITAVQVRRDLMLIGFSSDTKKGYDVEVLKKRGRRPIGDGAARVVPVRMDDSLVAAVDQRAEKDGTSRSEIIRSAVRAFVA